MTLHPLLTAITANAHDAKIGALEAFCSAATFAELSLAASELQAFGQHSRADVHQRARALFQAYAIYQFFLPQRVELPSQGEVPYTARSLLLERRFAEAIEVLRGRVAERELSEPLASALACAYRGLAFHLLADEVQRCVRQLTGNRWMFRISHPLDYPLRMRRELLQADVAHRYPVLTERTPVRMDLSHSGWSDIFALGMAFPEGARVINLSVDLAPRGSGRPPAPPINCWLRVIEEPVLRLCSVDLRACADLTHVSDVFDFARDPLGLLKAAVVASGIVPPGFEGSAQPLGPLLERLVGAGRGLEIASHVTGIPKGSRLAVSTNLLAGLIALCMRATSQISALEGAPTEGERRIIAGRAILGEWLGGSGGGWQDSGGIWPGIKIIEGVPAGAGDVEFGSSRGCLLPRHTVLGFDAVSTQARRALQESLVFVHGGMAANVGPVLETVTERFLLGTTREWHARQQLMRSFDGIVEALRLGDIRALGGLTCEAFERPLQAIIPGVSNIYTERLIAGARQQFGDRFWGFWMMGGMAGGGMGLIFDPAVKAAGEDFVLELMGREKQALEHGLPFAIDPVVYDFRINEVGTTATLSAGGDAIFSAEYYLLMLPRWLHEGSHSSSPSRREELDAFSNEYLAGTAAAGVSRELVARLFSLASSPGSNGERLDELLARNGFDADQHERLRSDLEAGRIGLERNRLPPETLIEDARPDDVVREQHLDPRARRVGEAALRAGKVAVVTLAAGAGSRWTLGAGTVKGLHPFAKLGGRFRTFIEVHLAKTRQTARRYGRTPAHVVTTGQVTHAPIAKALELENLYGLSEAVRLSEARSIGLRLVPTRRDLQFSWHPTRQQKLEARKQRVRDSARDALLSWVARTGEASDFRDGPPEQCVYPMGHWYEVANLMLNGTLHGMLLDNPALEYLLLHNVDTLGASLEPALLGHHIESARTLSFEVTQRRFEDRGGGLSRVNGCLRLIEELALPRPEDEAKLSYYNSLSTWISIDPLLGLFGLNRGSLSDPRAVLRGVRGLSARMPTYVTLKEVLRRWHDVREDSLVVAQFEKLWGDMSWISDANVGYFLVSRCRGQQLKEPAQLDAWWQDGSREYVERLCDFE